MKAVISPRSNKLHGHVEKGKSHPEGGSFLYSFDYSVTFVTPWAAVAWCR